MPDPKVTASAGASSRSSRSDPSFKWRTRLYIQVGVFSEQVTQMRPGEETRRTSEERVLVAEDGVCPEIVEEGLRPDPDCLVGRPCAHGFLLGVHLGLVSA